MNDTTLFKNEMPPLLAVAFSSPVQNKGKLPDGMNSPAVLEVSQQAKF